MSKTIMDLPDLLLSEIPSELQRMFDACVLEGNLKVPETLIPKVARWYGSRDDRHPRDAVVRASQQRVVRTLNNFTFEATQFNELRAKRPVQKPDTASLLAFIEDAKRDCDFCDPHHMTSEDVWGRIESTHCITAANAAKYDAHHGMVIFHPHHPHRFGCTEVRDYLQVAWSWFCETRAKISDNLNYPFLMWNCLGSAGASLVHGHLHMLTNSRGYYGRQKLMVSRAEAYPGGPKKYFDDWRKVHCKVGLARKWSKDVHVVATMTPVKEKEMIISGPFTPEDGVGSDFADALTAVL